MAVGEAVEEPRALADRVPDAVRVPDRVGSVVPDHDRIVAVAVEEEESVLLDTVGALVLVRVGVPVAVKALLEADAVVVRVREGVAVAVAAALAEARGVPVGVLVRAAEAVAEREALLLEVAVRDLAELEEVLVADRVTAERVPDVVPVCEGEAERVMDALGVPLRTALRVAVLDAVGEALRVNAD